MALPDFIVIGAMKAGTTTLHESLKMHPEIGISNFKEPNYFSQSFHKNLEWYKKLFPEGKSKYGEVSPSYTMRQKFPETARRMFETIPGVKLIYILRDPIDRIISHLHHNLYRDRIKLKDIDQVVLENETYVAASSYYFQITPFLEFFELNNILFVEMDDLKKDPNRVLNNVCEFIGVSPFDFTDYVRVSFKSSNRYLIKYHDTVHKYLPKPLAKLYHWFFYFLGLNISRPVLKKSTLITLKSSLMDDVKKLKAKTGKEFKNWKTYNEINTLSD